MGNEVLRLARKDAGLSRVEAARQIGVTEDVLRGAEEGRSSRPTARLRIALFYGLRPRDIWGQ
jgi:transcriptional regulator with XRE-family HTH domain